MLKQALDNESYLQLQSARIRERVDQFGGKLYIEFGGKLFDDYHAVRVLPGFRLNSKVELLKSLADQVEVVIVINANDIQAGKARNDNGLSYEDETMRLIEDFSSVGLLVSGVVITHYAKQPQADAFRKYLKNSKIKAYVHYPIIGYPHNIDAILSPDGFGKNDYIKTKRPIVIATAPGPGSGKMAFCLSQLYHDYTQGIKSGFAKYETFPVWNLGLNHPVNLAYEAATVDLNDVNVLDFYHINKYGTPAVSYNRDMEVFPILEKMFERIYGTSPYASPTDMGVNMIGFAITDDEAAKTAAKQEIIRRYYETLWKNRIGRISDEAVLKIQTIMTGLSLSVNERPCVPVALSHAELKHVPAVAIELNDGTMIEGRQSDLFSAPAAALINALKHLAGIDQQMLLLPPSILETMKSVKANVLHAKTPRLNIEQVLFALAINADNNPMAKMALSKTHLLEGAEGHSSVHLGYGDQKNCTKLGIRMTAEPNQSGLLIS